MFKLSFFSFILLILDNLDFKGAGYYGGLCKSEKNFSENGISRYLRVLKIKTSDQWQSGIVFTLFGTMLVGII